MAKKTYTRLIFRLFLITLTAHILISCQASVRSTKAPRLNTNENQQKLLLGKWVNTNSDRCWGDSAEFLPNGIKKVEIKYCDETDKIQTGWYTARWSINNNVIREETFEQSEIFYEMDKTPLPSVEFDSILLLNKQYLKVKDSRAETLYRRENPNE
ncbi:MAG: hypothetical protein RL497_2137 [Pseudomonadota bacterium]